MISTPILKLPHILKNKMPYITCDQLAYLLKNPKSSPYDNLILLDARSPFEFENCHIKTALNVIYPSQIKKILDDFYEINVIFYIFNIFVIYWIGFCVFVVFLLF